MALKILAPKFSIKPKSENLQAQQTRFLDLCSEQTADIYVAPEYLFASKQPVTAKEKEKILNNFLNISKGNKLIIPGTIAWTPNNKDWYNSLYALSDGKIIHEYHKETTNEEKEIYPEMNYMTPENQSSIFTWNNLTIGTEICRDHGMGRLKRHLKKHSMNPVDLQLVLASNTLFSPQQFAVKDNGLVMLVDGGEQNTSNSVTDSKNTKLYSAQNEGADYEIYHLELK